MSIGQQRFRGPQLRVSKTQNAERLKKTQIGPGTYFASGAAGPTTGTDGQESGMNENGGKMRNALIDVSRLCLSRRVAPGRRTGPCSSGIKRPC
jgi:hypothetical protein